MGHKSENPIDDIYSEPKSDFRWVFCDNIKRAESLRKITFRIKQNEVAKLLLDN